MQVVIDFADDKLEEVDRLARNREVSRETIIDEAITAFVKTYHHPGIEAGFGAWATRGFQEDGVAYQERLRSEW